MKKTILIALLLMPFQAFSAQIELNSGNFWGHSSGVGAGRGISFLADSSFSIDSIGIYGDLTLESFDVQVWSSTNGHQSDSVLATSSAVVGGTGLNWQDIAIDFDFTSGLYYGLNWRPTDGGSSNWGSIDYYNDNGLPTSASGLVTLIDGSEGFNMENYNNFLHPHLRFNTVSSTQAPTVPEPISIVLLSLGLAGFGLSRKTKLNKGTS